MSNNLQDSDKAAKKKAIAAGLAKEADDEDEKAEEQVFFSTKFTALFPWVRESSRIILIQAAREFLIVILQSPF